MSHLKKWPETERPRERLIKHGAQSLSDAQLLAIVLRTGSNRKNVIDTAMELIQRFGGLRGLDEAPLSELKKFKGLGVAKIAQIKASFELGKRLLSEKAQEQTFNSAETVYNYFFPKLNGLKKEVFITALLDTKLKLIKEVKVSEGTLNQSLIHPREVFKEAVQESAYAVVLIHNHPSGDPTPSKQDIEITKKLKKASEYLEIPIIDHVIIGSGKYFSMKENGMF